MSAEAIRCLAFYGPFVGSNPLTWRARLVLCCMAEGHEDLAAVSTASGLDQVEVLDAFHELGTHLFAIWALGRVWYRIGEHFRGRRGESLENELDQAHG